MYYVYILRLQSGDYYIGFAKDLKRRLKEHEQRQVNTTKASAKKFKLVTYVAFDDKIKALNFEKYLKTGSGFAFRNRHLV